MALALPVFFWLEPEEEGPQGVYWGAALGLWVLLWTVSWLAVATKRLHDLDISGWWVLGFMFLLFLGTSGLAASFSRLPTKDIEKIALGVAIIWLGSAKGTVGSNRFGPDPIPRLADKGTS